jgi:hypothetical protein
VSDEPLIFERPVLDANGILRGYEPVTLEAPVSAEFFSPVQFATLVVCTINANPHKDDLLDPEMSEVDIGCCPRCCAGCGVLQELIESDDLDYLLRTIAPKKLGVKSHDWWDTDQDRFDLSWADAWWLLYPCPNEHKDDDADAR